MLLRSFTVDDAPAMHPLFSDRGSMRLIGMLPELHTIDETIQRLSLWQSDPSRFAVVPDSEDAPIGYIALNPDTLCNIPSARELSFALLPEYRGKGYMRSALSLLIPALPGQGITCLWACCFKENEPCKRLIKSLGFKYQGWCDYQPANDKVYRTLEYIMLI